MSEKRARVLITESMPLINEELKILSRYADVKIANTTDVNVLKSMVKDVDVVMVVYAKITGEMIREAERLKGIVRYGVGVDNIDLEAATERGVLVANVPDYGVNAVAEFTWALILALARRIVVADRYMRRREYIGAWSNPPSFLRGVDLEGRVLGVVGFGRIGRAVASRARGFGMRVLFYDPYVADEYIAELDARKTSLEDLLRSSDIVSIHATLTRETHHLINEDRLRLMKPSAFLINTARGSIVDEKALYRALKEGWIGGAAIDVYEIEPPPPNNPLLDLENIILTPHIAWYSEEALKRLEMGAVEEAIRIIRGEIPRNLVNREVLRNLKK